jgi:SAM-dependent methyltransferase
MREHPQYGLTLPEHGWVPSPGYVLRRDRVLAKIAAAPPGGRALEIGCGAGALLHDLAKRGYACEALETSERAFEVASSVFRDRSDVRIWERPRGDWSERFDLVLAFEVLEHIEDDRAALMQWVRWLRPGGQLVLSVPAHQRRWNPTDEWAGHFRRYESAELASLMESAGLEVRDLECYGFPLANVLEAIRARTWQRGRRAADATARAEGTAASGVERKNESRLFPLQASLPGRVTMRAFCRLQVAFAHTELGNGFLALARKQPLA